MGLPWFSFNIKDFLANTSRLNTEATGAYLMLMLDYYEHENPPPDDDEVLATIVGLPIETWVKHRRVIIPLFDRDTVPGRLYHQRIEEEIEKGHVRHANSIKGLEAAAAGRASKKAIRDAAKIKNTHQEAVEAPREITREAPSRATHKQEHSIERVSNDTLPRADESEVAKEALQETLIPADFSITGSDTIRCTTEGYSTLEVSTVLDSFKRYNVNAGTFSTDWIAAWWRWWDRKKPALLPATKPRIEVTKKIAKPIPEGWAPNAGHLAFALQLGLDCHNVEDIFRDYCASSGKKYVDHDAAFRGFLRNQPNFNRGKPNGQTPSRGGSITDASRRLDGEIDRAIAALEGGQPDGAEAVRELPEGGLRPPGLGADDDGEDS